MFYLDKLFIDFITDTCQAWGEFFGCGAKEGAMMLLICIGGIVTILLGGGKRVR